ncbi:hypothetical protein I7I53_05710 [Histoplasma capsulatum var. duboisii H88]|uniref:Uncharacterized protein n=1 Tax=Ajellomyces capsulatus (strain H88) TaxID=544711 RepID=A0A8A1LSR8_AJEC8|nr:hypothetical protein I7I53_05710 [Histoplasma capsulatum var. duboisii H88]
MSTFSRPRISWTQVEERTEKRGRRGLELSTCMVVVHARARGHISIEKGNEKNAVFAYIAFMRVGVYIYIYIYISIYTSIYKR